MLSTNSNAPRCVGEWVVSQDGKNVQLHYGDVIMTAMASQIASLTMVYSTVYSGADKRNIKVPSYWPFVRGIYRRPVNSPHKGPVTRKMFKFDDVIMRKTSLHVEHPPMYLKCRVSAQYCNASLRKMRGIVSAMVLFYSFSIQSYVSRGGVGWEWVGHIKTLSYQHKIPIIKTSRPWDRLSF